MYCRNCGKSIEDDANFCKHCGTNLVPFNSKRRNTEDKLRKSILFFWKKFGGLVIRLLLFFIWFAILAYLADGIDAFNFCGDFEVVVVYGLLLIPLVYLIWYICGRFYRWLHKKAT